MNPSGRVTFDLPNTCKNREEAFKMTKITEAPQMFQPAHLFALYCPPIFGSSKGACREANAKKTGNWPVSGEKEVGGWLA